MKSLPLKVYAVIVSGVIGSGFLTGKEIAVFFAQFGWFSVLFLPLVFVCFFGLFFVFLTRGKDMLTRINGSKPLRLCLLAISLALTAAMLSGINSILQNFDTLLYVAIMLLLLAICANCLKNGLKNLKNINFLIFLIIFAGLIYVFFHADYALCAGQNIFSAAIYGVLYAALNSALCVLPIASYSASLTKKQKVGVSFFSALTLCLVILLLCMVIQSQSYALNQDMPLLSILSEGEKALYVVVLFLGCASTLFSLVFSSGMLLKTDNLSKKVLICVILPYILSFFGFGKFVSFVYPLLAAVAVALVADLIFYPLFKQVDRDIHGDG